MNGLNFLFAPGAGASSSHPWMQHWKQLLSTIGTVELMDYPYMLEGRKRPDPLPKLVEAHREALHRLQATRKTPVILVGKSMGSRIGCHLALTERVAGIVCLGYPLCGGGDPKKLRDQVLRDLTTRVLFVQGTRDALCPLNLLEGVRKQMKAPSKLHIVKEGDHSLLATKRWLKDHSKTQGDVDAEILLAISQWLAREESGL